MPSTQPKAWSQIGHKSSGSKKGQGCKCWKVKVRPERLELPTLGSEDQCSIQLSYGRIILVDDA